MTERRELYPPISPFQTGHLDVGDGQRLYFEVSGNPDGKPVVFLHGGPGGGTSPVNRQLFDPEAYRIVLFDQRGCGKSLPHASEPAADLSTNTTWHLVEDIERLREHLGIDRWQVFGGSWGSTLALAYAQTHRPRVNELVLRGIFTLREAELSWYYEAEGHGAGTIFPERFAEYLAVLTPEERGACIASYNRRLFNPDPDVHIPAAVAWTKWEASTSTLLDDPQHVAEATEPHNAVAFARIENHYFFNRGWLEEGQLIADAHLLDGVPGVIVQGRYDVVCPPTTAYDLHRAWPSAEFIVVPDAGHSFNEPGTRTALLDATDRFADLQP